MFLKLYHPLIFSEQISFHQSNDDFLTISDVSHQSHKITITELSHTYHTNNKREILL